MTKVTKLSLAAVLAVAGLTTANAKPLTEAIEGVDVSGTVVYRYNDYTNDKSDVDRSTHTNNYKIAVNLNAPVNEDVKLHTRTIVSSNGTDMTSLDYGTSGDSTIDVAVSHIYFSYTGLTNTTFNVGKQGLVTPWTVAIDSDGGEQTGTGISALSTWGPVTVAGGWYNQTNINGDVHGSADMATLGVVGNIGPVTLDAWYANVDEVDFNIDVLGVTVPVYGNGVNTFTLGAKANFELGQDANIGFDARYTDLELEDSTAGQDDEDNAAYMLNVHGKMGIFNANVRYAGTDSDGGFTAFDNDAATTYNGWNITLNDKADADLWQVGLGAQVLEKLHVQLNYTDVDYVKSDNDMNENELMTQITYDMSKNFKIYTRLGLYNADNDTANTEENDDTRGRVQFEYKF